MPWKNAALDGFVVAAERRKPPAGGPKPRGRIAKRQKAQADDAWLVAQRGVSVPLVATREVDVPVGGHPDVRIRIYWPNEQEAEPGAGLPVLVYMFGGGYTLGNIDWASWDLSFRKRAHDAGIILIAVDYALAPEAQFPTQPEQCLAALKWANEHAASIGGSSSAIAIGGASSGGNLAAAVTLMNRDRRQIPLLLQLLENPVVDLSLEHIEVGAAGSVAVRLFGRAALRRLIRDYLGGRRSRQRNPYASPLLAKSHSGLPPAWIVTCELDALRGDGEAYARALSAAGVPVVATRFLGQNHTSLGYLGDSPAAASAHIQAVAVLRLLHTPDAIKEMQGNADH